MKKHERITQKSVDELSVILCDAALAEKTASGDFAACYVDAALSLYFDGNTKACAYLARAAKKKAVCDMVNNLVTDRHLFYDKLADENPKMRKNTAKLLGMLGNPEDTQPLILALQNEKVRMVIPSLILALGAIGTDEAFIVLCSYKVEPAKDETETKHEKEETDALKKALGSRTSSIRHTFTGFDKLPCVQLTCAKGMGKYVSQECRQCGLNLLGGSDTVISVKGDNNIFKVRSFREALIPVLKKDEQGDIAQKVLEILDNTHEVNAAMYRYRIEYRGDDDRREGIDRLVKALDNKRLFNSVSDYECEIRQYRDGSVKLKLCTADDNRFSYRKGTVSASIHPSNAASVMQFAGKYFVENASVLDMCCGSGTMLFERHKYMPCRRIMGVDITQNAIDVAKENAKSFKNTLFYHCDCRKFTLREPVDEIISNLPFGSRVGTHTDNTSLYKDIFDNMQKWIKSGGIIVLYSMETKLIHELLTSYPCYKLLDTCKTEAGGLMPTVFVMKCEK